MPVLSPEQMKTYLVDAFSRNTPAYLSGPYHLLASFETFNRDGTPNGEGSIEKYFAAPGRVKVTTRFGSGSMTTYYVRDQVLYTNSGFDGTIMTYFANEFLLDFLPPPQGIIGRKLETSSVGVGDATLNCGTFQFYLEPPRSPYPSAPKEMFCVSNATHDLVLRRTLAFTIEYKGFAPFLGRSIAREIVASEDGVVRCRIHIAQLDEAKLDDSALTPPPSASPLSPGPEWRSTSAAELTPKRGATGTSGVPVTGLALISSTGTVKDYEPLYAPSPEIAARVAGAVKHWKYAPIVRQGEPVETILSIHVLFGS